MLLVVYIYRILLRLAIKISSYSEPGHVLTRGYVGGWSRAIISTTARSSGKRRAFVLVPSDEDGELALGTFKVVGSFAIEEKINNAQKAREAFDSSELALLR